MSELQQHLGLSDEDFENLSPEELQRLAEKFGPDSMGFTGEEGEQ